MIQAFYSQVMACFIREVNVLVADMRRDWLKFLSNLETILQTTDIKLSSLATVINLKCFMFCYHLKSY